MTHNIEVITTTQRGDRARIRLRCNTCGLRATITTRPARVAADLLQHARTITCHQIGQAT